MTTNCDDSHPSGAKIAIRNQLAVRPPDYQFTQIEGRIAAIALERDKSSQLIGLGPAKSVRDEIEL